MDPVISLVATLGGVASTKELGAAGHTLRAIDRPVRRGELVRLRPGWVAAPTAPSAVVRVVRAGATLSCVTVLHRHGAWAQRDGNLHARIGARAAMATVNGRSKTRLDASRDGLIVHRDAGVVGLQPARGGVDSLAQAVAQAVVCQSRVDAVASLDSVLNRGLLPFDEIRSLLHQLPARYAGVLPLIDPRAQSGLETLCRLGLKALNIRCRSQVWIEGVGRVDLLVGDRLIIETDGRRWHSGADQDRIDYGRDLAATERGYLVLRLSYEQVMHDWDRVALVIRSLVARGEHRWSPRHAAGRAVRCG
jgi:very-short-patch-repair endonuclease